MVREVGRGVLDSAREFPVSQKCLSASGTHFEQPVKQASLLGIQSRIWPGVAIPPHQKAPFATGDRAPADKVRFYLAKALLPPGTRAVDLGFTPVPFEQETFDDSVSASLFSDDSSVLHCCSLLAAA